MTYTITVTNAGPTDATGATVADTFPAVLTGDTGPASARAAARCTAAGAGNINDTVNLPAGGTVTYTATATIVAVGHRHARQHRHRHRARRRHRPQPGQQQRHRHRHPDAAGRPGHHQDRRRHHRDAGRLRDLHHHRHATPARATRPGATVADTFPAALTCTLDLRRRGRRHRAPRPASGNINDTVNLPGRRPRHLHRHAARSRASATGTLSNTATVAAPAGVTDPNPGNNRATDTDTLTPQADLSITKTDGVTIGDPGLAVTYTIIVSNAGPSNAAGATVTDTFPAPLTGDSWTAVATGGATGCTAGGTGNINDTVNLPAGASVTYTVTATISAGATGTLSNTATVAAPADPTPGNNSATDSDTLVPSANLSISKTGPATGTAGTAFSYTIVVGNTGPSNAAGVIVTDATPASFSSPTFTVNAGPSNPWTGSTTLASLASGGTATIVVTGTPTLATTITNQATVSATIADPASGNNTSATVSTVVSPGVASKLVFAQQPTDAYANDIIVPAVTVQVTDLYGNPTTASGNVTLTLSVRARHPLRHAARGRLSGRRRHLQRSQRQRRRAVHAHDDQRGSD